MGYSGHAFVLLDILLANQFGSISYCDQTEKSYNPYDLIYLGDENNDDILEKLKKKDTFIGIGDNQKRSRVYRHLTQNGISTPVLKHPSSSISPSVVLGKATVVMPGVMINALSKIGNAVICNTSAIIEHECLIGDYVHIAPGAVLAGNVHVGDYSFIGANAIVKQNVKIGSNVIIGAGAVVLKDVPDNIVVFGNPAINRI